MTKATGQKNLFLKSPNWIYEHGSHFDICIKQKLFFECSTLPSTQTIKVIYLFFSMSRP